MTHEAPAVQQTGFFSFKYQEQQSGSHPFCIYTRAKIGKKKRTKKRGGANVTKYDMSQNDSPIDLLILQRRSATIIGGWPLAWRLGF